MRAQIHLLLLLSGTLMACDSRPSSGSEKPHGDVVDPPDAGDAGGHEDAPAAPVPGSYCDDASDCSSGLCVADGSGDEEGSGVCSAPCKTDADCTVDGTGISALSCGVGAGGLRQCLPGCGSLGYACVDDEPVICSEADEQYCAECGCPDDLRCAPGMGCVAKAKVGEPCGSDQDCKSANCSSFAGVCRVAVGQACSTENCDLCAVSTSSSYCTRQCGGGEDVCNGLLCTATGQSKDYWCDPACNDESTCDGVCRHVTGTSLSVCDCSGPGCEYQIAPHQLGQLCTGYGQCASDICLGGESEDYDIRGICSKECTTSADCGEGQACADFPCGEITDNRCGLRCMPKCSDATTCVAGSCEQLTDHEGNKVSVCDARLDPEESCDDDRDCKSGACVVNQCTNGKPIKNGGKCDVPDDCKSGQCLAGICRGTAELGDDCKVAEDCAVGICCEADDRCHTDC